MSQEMGLSELHAEILAIMEDLELPAPERMLGRIEDMLPKGDRTRVLKALVQDSQRQSKQETKRILKVLGSKDEWAVEVDRLLRNYSPA
jgi:hypothetical protein